MDAPSPQERIDDITKDVAEKLHRLESLVERLELIPLTHGISQQRSPLTVKPASGRRVFIVHGHDQEARETTARFLERLDLEAVILHEQATCGRTIVEKLEHYSDVDFAVILLTPDDVGAAKSSAHALQPRARQNVILELATLLRSSPESTSAPCIVDRSSSRRTIWESATSQSMTPAHGNSRSPKN